MERTGSDRGRTFDKQFNLAAVVAALAAASCGPTGAVGNEGAHGGANGYYCPDQACTSAGGCCTGGSCASPTCIPVPSGLPAPVQWWTQNATYSAAPPNSGCSTSYDLDNGNIQNQVIVLPHDSEYLGDYSSYAYNSCAGAWGFGPSFYDTVTGVKFHLNHIRPGFGAAALGNTQTGTMLKAGSYVGISGGNTCETGYCSNGYSSTYGYTQCLVSSCGGANKNGNGACPLEYGGTATCYEAHSCSTDSTSAQHLCVVQDPSTIPSAFCPSPTTLNCGAGQVPTCSTCPAGQVSNGSLCVSCVSNFASRDEYMCGSYTSNVTNGAANTLYDCYNNSISVVRACGSGCVEVAPSSAYCCTPNCSGKTCGSDGCGGSCGTCPFNYSCSSSQVCTPPPAPSGGWIYPGQALLRGGYLWSTDGRFFLALQGDGNLCLYWNGHGVLWCAYTNPNGNQAVMQGDGNFAVYDSSGHYIWGTYPGNIRQVQPNSSMALQNDGNFVEYGSTGASWSSGTSGH